MARIGKTNLTQLPSSKAVDGAQREINSSSVVKPQHLIKVAGALSQQLKELATKVAHFQEQTYQAVKELDREVSNIDVSLGGVSGSNGVASYLKTATGLVNVSSASAPIAGQVLTATTSSLATWQTPVTASASASIGVWLADAPPSSSSVYDDEFTGVSQSMNAKWSLWNPSGNCSYGVEQNWGLIENQTGAIIEGIYQAMPSSSFAAYAKVAIIRESNTAGEGRAGLFLAAGDIATNPTGSKAYTVGISVGTFGTGLFSTQATSYTETIKWGKYDSADSYPYSSNYGSNTHLYIRVRVNPGLTVSFDVSSDGKGWSSIDPNASLGFTPLYFGVYGWQYGSAGRAMVKFFRVFTGSGSQGQYNTSIGRVV